jgi:hypothetical protein
MVPATREVEKKCDAVLMAAGLIGNDQAAA